MFRYNFVPRHRTGHREDRRLRSHRRADDRRAGAAAGHRASSLRRHPDGDPGDPQEERVVPARAGGGHRGVPHPDRHRGRGDRRGDAVDRQADLGLLADHQAGRLDDLQRVAAPGLRHPRRDPRSRGGDQVPHRRRAVPGDGADRQEVPLHDHLAHQGHVRAGHLGEAHPAGRPLQAADQGSHDRFPRLDHAQRPRRGLRDPHPGQGVDERGVLR